MIALKKVGEVTRYAMEETYAYVRLKNGMWARLSEDYVERVSDFLEEKLEQDYQVRLENHRNSHDK